MEKLQNFYFFCIWIAPIYYSAAFLVGQLLGGLENGDESADDMSSSVVEETDISDSFDDLDGLESFDDLDLADGVENIDLSNSFDQTYLDIELDTDLGSDLDLDIDGVEELEGSLDVEVGDIDEVDLDHDSAEVSEDLNEESRTSETVDSDAEYRVSYLSLRIWVTFISIFGLGGYYSIKLFNASIFSSISTGLVVSVLATIVFVGVLRYIFSHTIVFEKLPKVNGRKGEVTVPIPSRGVGLVCIDLIDEKQEYRAMSINKRKIGKGQKVVVQKYIPREHLIIVKKI